MDALLTGKCVSKVLEALIETFAVVVGIGMHNLFWNNVFFRVLQIHISICQSAFMVVTEHTF